MKKGFTYDLMEDPAKLNQLGFFSDEVYRVLLACQRGDLAKEDLKSRYYKTAAILILDMTGLTKAVMDRGVLHGLLSFTAYQNADGRLWRMAWPCPRNCLYETTYECSGVSVQVSGFANARSLTPDT